MTHPKLPPKSVVFDLLMNTSAIEDSNLLCDYETQIIAAVAEVEWRKRAARWEALINVSYQRWRIKVERSDLPIPTPDWNRFRRPADQCYDIAKQWREWGEGEK